MLLLEGKSKVASYLRYYRNGRILGSCHSQLKRLVNLKLRINALFNHYYHKIIAKLTENKILMSPEWFSLVGGDHGDVEGISQLQADVVLF